MTSDLIFSWLGQLLAAGIAVAIVAFPLFKFWGANWIKNQFAKDLEAAKSELSILVARQMKLHEQEYVVFPEVWAKLNKAMGSLGEAIVGLRRIPDFRRMSEIELQTWVKGSDLSDHEIADLASEPDKIKAYSDILDNRSVVAARRDLIDFHIYLQANRIFLSPEIKSKFDKIGDIIRSSWSAKTMDRDGHRLPDGTSFLHLAYEKYNSEAKPLMTEIEALLQKKIFPESTANQTGRAA